MRLDVATFEMDKSSSKRK